MIDPLKGERDEDGASASDSNKEARDTIVGCRERAAEDLSNAAQASTDNGRKVLERSAATWEKRADELHELELGSAEQRRADKALWDSGESNPRDNS